MWELIVHTELLNTSASRKVSVVAYLPGKEMLCYVHVVVVPVLFL
jgi:hypothetical protein